MISTVGPKILLELGLPEAAIDNDQEFDWNPDHEDTPFDGLGLASDQMNTAPMTLSGLPNESLGSPQPTSNEISETDQTRREPLQHANRESDTTRESEQAARGREDRMSGTEKSEELSGKSANQGRDNIKLQQALRAAQRAQKAALKVGAQQGDGDESALKTQNTRAGKSQNLQMQEKTKNSPDAIRLAQAAQRVRKGDAAAAKRMGQVAQAISKAARSLMDKQTTGITIDTSSMDVISNLSLNDPSSLSKANQSQQVATVKAAVPTAPPAEFNEWMNLIKSNESGDAVLRLQDTEAGSLEIRVRVEGKDLFVALRAEDIAMRQRMLEEMNEVRRQIANEGLVDGNVHVGEFATSEGQSNLSQGQANESGNEGNQKAGQTTLSTTIPNHSDDIETSLEIGNLHIVA